MQACWVQLTSEKCSEEVGDYLIMNWTAIATNGLVVLVQLLIAYNYALSHRNYN